MDNQPLVLKCGTGESVRALGAKITFIGKEAEAWALMHVTAPRDIGPPPHAHAFGESYYILSGSFVFTLGTEQCVAEAGDFVQVPGGMVHGFKGASDEPAQLLTFQAPGDAGDFFRDVAREVTRVPADLPRVPEIGARHGISFAAATCHTPGPKA